MIEVPGHEILRVEVGSTLHGVGIGSDDLDLMAVTLEPRTTITGLGDFTHFTWRTADEGERSGPDDIDFVAYGLKKFMRLAMKGNPSVMALLFAPESHLHHCDEFGRELIALRGSIVSYRCKGRYLGYLNGQRERALNARPSGKGRREGREAKWASHMVRLGFQAVQILKTGTLMLPMDPDHAAIVKAVKRGEVTLSDALDLTRDLEEQASRIGIDQTALPPEPDTDAVEDWMHSAYLRAFASATN